jgi:acyl-CoA thioester hydrolase
MSNTDFNDTDKLPITYRGTVYPWHCDHMGHMNVMWYTGKFDEASWHFLSQIGLTRTFLQKHDRGLAAVQQNTTYKRELRSGEIITVRSGILEIRDKTIRLFHEMRTDETGEMAAFTMVTGVFMDMTLRKSCPLPADVYDRAKALILDETNFYGTEVQPAVSKPSAAF